MPDLVATQPASQYGSRALGSIRVLGKQNRNSSSHIYRIRRIPKLNQNEIAIVVVSQTSETGSTTKIPICREINYFATRVYIYIYISSLVKGNKNNRSGGGAPQQKKQKVKKDCWPKLRYVASCRQYTLLSNREGYLSGALWRSSALRHSKVNRRAMWHFHSPHKEHISKHIRNSDLCQVYKARCKHMVNQSISCSGTIAFMALNRNSIVSY